MFLLTILDDLFFNLVLVMPETLGMKTSESSDFSVSDFVLLSELDESLDRSGMAPKLTLEVEDEEPSSSSFELNRSIIGPKVQRTLNLIVARILEYRCSCRIGIDIYYF